MVRYVTEETIESEAEKIEGAHYNPGFRQCQESFDIEKKKQNEIPKMMGIAMQYAHASHGKQ